MPIAFVIIFVMTLWFVYVISEWPESTKKIFLAPLMALGCLWMVLALVFSGKVVADERVLDLREVEQGKGKVQCVLVDGKTEDVTKKAGIIMPFPGKVRRVVTEKSGLWLVYDTETTYEPVEGK
jgi:hypothetical protein